MQVGKKFSSELSQIYDSFFFSVHVILRHLFHGHAAPEHGRDGEVAAVTRVHSGHHVLGVEHLLRELGHRERAVLLAAPGCQRHEAGHEEVQPTTTTKKRMSAKQKKKYFKKRIKNRTTVYVEPSKCMRSINLIRLFSSFGKQVRVSIGQIIMLTFRQPRTGWHKSGH